MELNCGTTCRRILWMLLVYIGSKKIQEKRRHELTKAIKHRDAVSGAGCCLSHGSSDTITASRTILLGVCLSGLMIF